MHHALVNLVDTMKLAAENELLKICPDFLISGRQLTSKYIKVELLVDEVLEGLNKAGLHGII